MRVCVCEDGCVCIITHTHTVNTKRGGLGRGGCVWLSEECVLGHEYHLTVSTAQTTFGGCRG